MSVVPFRCFLNIRPRTLRTPASPILMFALIFLLSATHPCTAATILLDPGHGGDDNGATDGKAYFEKQFTLVLAQKIAALLAPDHRVEMTRSSDIAVSIDDRTGMANHLKADLMISIHAAVTPHCGDRKAAVYFHDDERLFFPPGITAHRQAGESGTDHPDWFKHQVRHQHQSQQLAVLIKQSLLDGGAFDHITVSGAPLAALMGADLPAVLIEVGCMHPSTAISASRIDEEIDKYAQSIANAVNLAITELNP